MVQLEIVMVVMYWWIVGGERVCHRWCQRIWWLKVVVEAACRLWGVGFSF